MSPVVWMRPVTGGPVAGEPRRAGSMQSAMAMAERFHPGCVGLGVAWFWFGAAPPEPGAPPAGLIWRRVDGTLAVV